MAKSSIPLGEWSGSDATNKLRAVIEKQHQEAAKQTTVMVPSAMGARGRCGRPHLQG
jgi:hypothetical protein